MSTSSIVPVGGPQAAYLLRQIRGIGARTHANEWGRLPELCLVSASGLLIVALGDAASVRASNMAVPLFWTGLLVVFMPVAARLATRYPARRERIGLVVMVGLAIYLVKVMHSPFVFTFADELPHWHNTNLILQNHTLFGWNSILGVTAFYPGLETLTSALVSLSRLPVFYAGLVVIGVARLILFLALYLVSEQISQSAHVASMATLIFMSHSNFVFWSAQYSYESLSLPLAIAGLSIVLRRESASEKQIRWALTVIASLVIGAIVDTHHLTSYFLAGFLMAWALITTLRTLDARHTFDRLHSLRAVKRLSSLLNRWAQQQAERGPSAGDGRFGPIDLALVALVLSAAWLVFAASNTIDYIRPVLSQALLSLVAVIRQQAGFGRQLFLSQNGVLAPFLERMIGITSVLLSLIGLPFGLYRVYQRRHGHSVLLVLACVAITYFGFLGLRLTPQGWETGNRAAVYAYVGLAFVLALAAVELYLARRTSWTSGLLAATGATILFFGGIISGWSPNVRLSLPYLVRVDDQTVEPESYAVVEWTRSWLGTGNVIAADPANGSLLLAYAQQRALTSSSPDAISLVNTPGFQEPQREIVTSNQIRYVLMDRRKISRDNIAGRYFDFTEGGAIPDSDLVDPAVYTKFDNVQASRIMDGGNIVIFDMGAFLNGSTPR